MRRPLDWLVVSIALLVLVASRMHSPPEAEFHSKVDTRTDSPSPAPAEESLFAYVHEDGTEEFLPVNGATPGEWEGAHALQFTEVSAAAAHPRVAVYTWSAPVSVDAPPGKR